MLLSHERETHFHSEAHDARKEPKGFGVLPFGMKAQEKRIHINSKRFRKNGFMEKPPLPRLDEGALLYRPTFHTR